MTTTTNTDIDWNTTHNVFVAKETGEYYVQVSTGFMIDTDYIEGGRVVGRFQIHGALIKVGRFSNREIDAAKYDLVAREDYDGTRL